MGQPPVSQAVIGSCSPLGAAKIKRRRREDKRGGRKPCHSNTTTFTLLKDCTPPDDTTIFRRNAKYSVPTIGMRTVPVWLSVPDVNCA